MNNHRVQFLPDQQRIFIEKVINISNLPIAQLAKLVKIHQRSFLDWRKEKLRMSLSAAEILSQKFKVILPESKEALVERWKSSVRKASEIGGKARYKKYGVFATKEGRRKGGLTAIKILRKRGIVSERKYYWHPDKSKLLAEFVGIMLGDGGITNTQCAITLNTVADAKYILFVSDLGAQLFGYSPGIYIRKTEKATILYYNGIDLVDYLLSIGLKIGNKVKQQVGVPSWILSRREYKIACVRGLMDTDGGVFPHKYKVNGKEYSYNKICFTNRSMPLLLFVFNVLKEIGLTPKLLDKVENKKVWLYNAQEVRKYLQLINSNNERLLKHNRETSHSLV